MRILNKLDARPIRASVGERCPSDAPLAQLPYMGWASGRGPEIESQETTENERRKTTMPMPKFKYEATAENVRLINREPILAFDYGCPACGRQHHAERPVNLRVGRRWAMAPCGNVVAISFAGVPVQR
jgi:hypothetical protein